MPVLVLLLLLVQVYAARVAMGLRLAKKITRQVPLEEVSFAYRYSLDPDPCATEFTKLLSMLKLLLKGPEEAGSTVPDKALYGSHTCLRPSCSSSAQAHVHW